MLYYFKTVNVLISRYTIQFNGRFDANQMQAVPKRQRLKNQPTNVGRIAQTTGEWCVSVVASWDIGMHKVGERRCGGKRLGVWLW